MVAVKSPGWPDSLVSVALVYTVMFSSPCTAAIFFSMPVSCTSVYGWTSGTVFSRPSARPPRTSSFSTSTTSCPASEPLTAAVRPVQPPPSTRMRRTPSEGEPSGAVVFCRRTTPMFT